MTRIFILNLALWLPLLVSSQNMDTRSITAMDENIIYGGALYPKSNEGTLELLRFPTDLLDNSTPATHGFNPDKARTTAGAWLTFKTDSPKISIQLESNGRETFGIFQNQKFVAIAKPDKSGELFIESTAPGQPVQYRIAMPTWHNPKIKAIKIGQKSSWEAPTLPKRGNFVAIGDSITHGRGQDVSHQSWGWQASELLDLNFYNLAVGGSNANPFQPTTIKELDKVDLVSILWGYNDWVNRGKTVEQYTVDMKAAIKVIRKHHKETPITILKLLQTRSTVSKRTGDQFSAQDFRQAAEALVYELKNEETKISMSSILTK